MNGYLLVALCASIAALLFGVVAILVVWRVARIRKQHYDEYVARREAQHAATWGVAK